LVQDSLKELQDLKVVHTFYLGLLEKNLGHSVPVPLEIKNITDQTENAAQLIAEFKLWLNLLDLALTPPLVRDALKTLPGLETSHALLRYFTVKASQRPGDRDKTDCIITQIFRTPSQRDSTPQWHRPRFRRSRDTGSRRHPCHPRAAGSMLSNSVSGSLKRFPAGRSYGAMARQIYPL
jgi:hypothetical protein